MAYDSTTDCLLRDQIGEIWAECLNIDPIDPDDDFFSLGGSSVQAARIFARLERLVGQTMPLSGLYEAPSVNELATWVRRRLQSESVGSDSGTQAFARSLAGSGNRNKLFVIPGIGGGVVGLGYLARSLGSSAHVIGLESRGLDDGLPPATSVSTIAAEFLADIRALQPEGPYALCGICWGSVVALEIALELRRAGEPVACLAMLDPPPLSKRRPGDVASAWQRWRAMAAYLGERATDNLQRLFRVPAGERAAYLRQRARLVAGVVTGSDAGTASRADLARNRVEHANRAALAQWNRRAYDGEICLMLSADRGDGPALRARQDWITFCRAGETVHHVGGQDSGDAISPAHVETVAAVIKKALAGIDRKKVSE